MRYTQKTMLSCVLKVSHFHIFTYIFCYQHSLLMSFIKILLGLEHVKNTNSKLQTHTQREGDQNLWGSARCLRSRGRKERSIDDLHRITRGLQLVLSKTLIRNQPTLKMGSLPLFIERRRNSQISSRSGPETVLTQLSVDWLFDRPKCAVDQRLTAYLNRSTG